MAFYFTVQGGVYLHEETLQALPHPKLIPPEFRVRLGRVQANNRGRRREWGDIGKLLYS